MKMIGLEFVRKQNNLTMNELAKYLNVSKQTISKWIRMEKKIPQDRLRQLSEKLHVPMDYLNKELEEEDKVMISALLSENVLKNTKYIVGDENLQNDIGILKDNIIKNVQVIEEDKDSEAIQGYVKETQLNTQIAIRRISVELIRLVNTEYSQENLTKLQDMQFILQKIADIFTDKDTRRLLQLKQSLERDE
ncbi:helix-turn-helix domain-containing protein [Anaerotignum sp.]|uniref:helix-turn-helix domain-containing protein n=1 Tax=Anaerotignum sp. TaxID=2039241 RepID=UPI00289C0EF2|nr:helix-turn-helix transcriptional regulator [Anaerotignum sp.]